MKAEIDAVGVLHIQPESETEAYALGCWIDSCMNEVVQPLHGDQLIKADSVRIGDYPERRVIG